MLYFGIGNRDVLDDGSRQVIAGAMTGISYCKSRYKLTLTLLITSPPTPLTHSVTQLCVCWAASYTASQ